MTEQIERELTELFHERAERLDVLPPLPPARVRRARLQSALAMASVVAVLAAGGVAGVRLASSSGGEASIAGSGSPRTQLERIAAKMLAGRWRIDATAHEKDGTTTTGNGPVVFSLDVEYDGATKSAIAHRDGNVFAIQVDGATYLALSALPDQLARYLPKGAHWQRGETSMFGAAPAIDALGLTGETSTHSTDASGGRSAPVGADIKAVRRTSTGFAVDSRDGDRATHTDITLRADGTIASAHIVTHRPTSGGSNGVPATTGTGIIDVVYTPLSAPVQVPTPDPSTVITDAQLQTAIHKSMFGSGPNGILCPTPMPAGMGHQGTAGGGGGGGVTTTGPSVAVACGMAVHVTPNHPGTPAVTPSPH